MANATDDQLVVAAYALVSRGKGKGKKKKRKKKERKEKEKGEGRGKREEGRGRKREGKGINFARPGKPKTGDFTNASREFRKQSYRRTRKSTFVSPPSLFPSPLYFPSSISRVLVSYSLFFSYSFTD